MKPVNSRSTTKKNTPPPSASGPQHYTARPPGLAVPARLTSSSQRLSPRLASRRISATSAALPSAAASPVSSDGGSFKEASSDEALAHPDYGSRLSADGGPARLQSNPHRG